VTAAAPEADETKKIALERRRTLRPVRASCVPLPGNAPHITAADANRGASDRRDGARRDKVTSNKI
jgi:hypothetical protein